MKNWDTIEPDRVNILNKHFTPSRGCGHKELIRVVDGHE